MDTMLMGFFLFSTCLIFIATGYFLSSHVKQYEEEVKQEYDPNLLTKVDDSINYFLYDLIVNDLELFKVDIDKNKCGSYIEFKYKGIEGFLNRRYINYKKYGIKFNFMSLEDQYCTNASELVKLLNAEIKRDAEAKLKALEAQCLAVAKLEVDEEFVNAKM